MKEYNQRSRRLEAFGAYRSPVVLFSAILLTLYLRWTGRSFAGSVCCSKAEHMEEDQKKEGAPLSFPKESIGPVEELSPKVARLQKKKPLLWLIARLGSSLCIKHATLLEMVRSSKKHLDLHKEQGWTAAMFRQAAAFIEMHAPTTGSNSMVMESLPGARREHTVTTGDLLLFLERLEAHQHEVAAYPVVPENPKLHGLNIAMQVLFAIPEIYTDFSCLEELFFVQMQKEYESSKERQDTLRGYLEMHGLGCSQERFIRILDLLRKAASTMALHKDQKTSMASYVERMESACSEIAQLLLDSAGAPGGANQLGATSESLFEALYQHVAVFYEVCPRRVNGMVLQGRKTVFPRAHHTSVFELDGETGQMRLRSVEKTFKSRQDVACFSNMRVQHVYYVDNEKQRREMVIIPVLGSNKLSCKQIIAYISGMYKKPEESLHVFGMNLQTRRWTYIDREVAEYTEPKSESTDIQVFYYIEGTESGHSQVLLRFVVFGPSSSSSTPLDQSMLRFPLFFNELFVESLDCFGFGHTLCRAQDSKEIAAIRALSEVVNMAPYVYMANPKSEKDYYINNAIHIDELTSSLDLDLGIANSSLKVEREEVHGKETGQTLYTYCSRTAGPGWYYSMRAKEGTEAAQAAYRAKDPRCPEIKTMVIRDSNVHMAPQYRKEFVVCVQSSLCGNSTAYWAIDGKAAYPRRMAGNTAGMPYALHGWELRYAIFYPAWSSMRSQLGVAADILEALTNEEPVQ
ncbi:uncharacterized protein NEMAJ01_0876 [Nematocida major]|uniref:uncharacterized protein n=1 Tax=Nematocida major TaxID=1912982 RepID=UPI002007AF52|nr:uncharacterized protein NEMAJ01_0876 [Nematocida major]KAH9385980.1 hypothetical protein NEMAJ01_0876 [Nematocida major]